MSGDGRPMQGITINHRKINRNGLTHVPSPRWVGAVLSAMPVISGIVLVTYVFADWTWQQERGWWNWVVIGGLPVLFGPAMRYGWRNDPRRSFTAEDLVDGESSSV